MPIGKIFRANKNNFMMEYSLLYMYAFIIVTMYVIMSMYVLTNVYEYMKNIYVGKSIFILGMGTGAGTQLFAKRILIFHYNHNPNKKLIFSHNDISNKQLLFMESKYKTDGHKIIFSPTFNEPLNPYHDTIASYNELIFENMTFSDRTIKSSFNRKIDFLPCTLTSITFNHHFNARVNFPNPFPSMWNDTIFSQTRTLKNIVFGHYYNAYTELPPSVINLTFGYCFNKPIDFSQNNNLTNIIFGEQFNQMIILPKYLLSLTICNKWNCKVILPEGLKSIYLRDTDGSRFPIEKMFDNLPNSIHTLDFGTQHIVVPTYNLPNSVRVITMRSNISNIQNIRCLPKHIDLLKITLFTDVVQTCDLTYHITVQSCVKTLDIGHHTHTTDKHKIILHVNTQNVIWRIGGRMSNEKIRFVNHDPNTKILSLEIIPFDDYDPECIDLGQIGLEAFNNLKQLVVKKNCCGNYWEVLPKSLSVFVIGSEYYYKTFVGWVRVY